MQRSFMVPALILLSTKCKSDIYIITNALTISTQHGAANAGIHVVGYLKLSAISTAMIISREIHLSKQYTY